VLCGQIEMELYSWGDPAALRSLALSLDDDALRQSIAAGKPADAALSHACAAAALALVDPSSPRTATLTMRAYNLLGQVTDRSMRMRAASKLLRCTPWLPDGVALALAREYGSMCACGDLSLFARLECCCAAAAWELEWGGALDAAQSLLSRGLGFAQALQMPRALYRLRLLQARLHIARGEHEAAIELMKVLAAQQDAGDAHEKAQIGVLNALILGAAGDLPSATNRARDLCRSPKVLGTRDVERCGFAQSIAAHCAAAGDARQAREWCDYAAACAPAGNLGAAGIAHTLIDSFLSITEGGCDIADSALPHAIASHYRRCLPGLFVMAPAFAAMVAELALEANAQRAHVKQIIDAQHLRAPSRACPQWPWPVKVSVLGTASVIVDGRDIPTAGRAQRLFELLRILVAAGPAGRSQQALERHLWPDSDGPKAALAVALHRLRKLLGDDDAITVQSGVLTLDRERVWTDADALLQLCERIDGLPASASQARVRRMAWQLLNLYGGQLHREDDGPWIVAYGSRLRLRFIAAAELLGARLEASGDWLAAGRIYRGMLDAEPLSEAAYRGLMRTAHAGGDLATAFSHYRFCRDTLSIILNRPPSAQTHRLAERLGLFEPFVRGGTALPLAA
jgi:DNA-binding SARP family transcriptional activator